MALETMKNANEIYEMKLHETRHIDNWTSVLRVHYGWIYEFTVPPNEDTDFGVFVPGPEAKQ